MENGQKPLGDNVKIYIGNTPIETHIVCGLLTSQNIDCEVRGEKLFNLQGEVPFDDSTLPYIWLNQPQQVQEAQQMINEYAANLKTPNVDWRCHHCKEMNEGNFALCWCCGESS